MAVSTKPFIPPKAPHLAVPTDNSDAVQQRQVSGQLRTYFQQTDVSNQQSATTLNSATTLLWLGDF